PYCHTEITVPARHHQRPRKNARLRLKRTLDSLLQDFERSPERVHDELQAWTARSHYARNILAGYFEQRPDSPRADPPPSAPTFDEDFMTTLLSGGTISL
ncbi:unnamed protein product, partial [Symbiodinium natans]